ncbi:MAG: M66 family metalloprotease [Shewanella xiamenensis]
MFKARFTSVAMLVASSLLTTSVHAQVTMQQAAEQTFNAINSIKQRAISGDGVIEQGNKRFIVYNNHRFELHDNNYPKFPFPYGDNARAPYYAAFPFLDEKWDIVINDNNGFYFIHDEFGSMSTDVIGCFIEYYPHPSFTDERIMRFENTECISAPSITEVSLSGLFDTGATVAWKGHTEGNKYQLSLTKIGSNQSVQHFNASTPQFYLGNLQAQTQYQLLIEVCNTTACVTLEPLHFTTEASKSGFHDGIRNLNHLDGDIEAHVSLMQSHSLTAPFGNHELNTPDVVIGREAMLLISPQVTDINQLWVEVYKDGELLARDLMQPPANQPKTDQYAVNDRPMVIFSHNVWSFPLKWHWVEPGLSLKFVDNHGRSSELAQHSMVFGGAPELVFQNIDMGMLTQPRGRNTMANNTAEHAADYFQKIPVSKLVIGQYAPAYFAKITMPNGKVYTERSDTDGGWHSGDMRGSIGKALISIGINNANVGINTTAGDSQTYNRRFNHITAHTNVGLYTDPTTAQTKTVVHGGSGGGGILTLEETTGNEWSHEVGHNFGLGHYPSMASVHDMESGWGWDAVFKRFIGNIDWRGAAAESSAGGETSQPYLNTFRFLLDAQAGGEGRKVGLVSNFTFEHPTQARRVQKWLNNGFNQQPTNDTYYVKWDQNQQRYIKADTDASSALQTGVPVTTLVGIYDPQGDFPSQIYPVLYGNYGNVFELAPAVEYKPINADHNLKGGWHQYRDLTPEQLSLPSWKTIVDNGSYQRLCQFSFATSTSDTVNLVGHVDTQTNSCRASDDMRWNIAGTWQNMVSAEGKYSLLYPYGRGDIVYTPTPAIGEVKICLLKDINNPSHNGAGFVQGNQCVQVAGIKHTNNAQWAYSIKGDNIEQGKYIHNNVCRLDVVSKNGLSMAYDLTAHRINSAQSNKFHLNLPQQELASVAISCEDSEGVRMLDSLIPALDTGLVDLPAAVIIGQEHGYDVLNSSIGTGWFDHNDSIDYNSLSRRDRNMLATMNVGSQKLPLCRFELAINGTMQTVYGFVEQLVTNDYRCSGGDEISVFQDGAAQRLESVLNQFQWLSLWDPERTGERVKAKAGSDQHLCSVTRAPYYGAGMVNDANQCAQVPGIKWSNGNNWAFSSGYGQYSFK